MPYKNINPTIWGAYLWKFMHYLTLSYPENPSKEEKDTLYNFFHTIQTVLPCEKCRYNFKSHLERSPLTEEILSNNVDVIRWLFDIHNEVNKATGKSELSYTDFIKMYSEKEEISFIQKVNDNKKNKNNCIITNLKNNKIFLGILMIAIIIIIIYLNKKF